MIKILRKRNLFREKINLIYESENECNTKLWSFYNDFGDSQINCLLFACKLNHMNIVKYLIEKGGVDIEVTEENQKREHRALQMTTGQRRLAAILIADGFLRVLRFSSVPSVSTILSPSSGRLVYVFKNICSRSLRNRCPLSVGCKRR